MKCPRCQQDNPPGSNFCLGCGVRLTLTCGSCGSDLPAGSRFCNKCGAPVKIGQGADPRFASPEVYTPKHLGEKILTSKASQRSTLAVSACPLSKAERGRFSATRSSATSPKPLHKPKRVFGSPSVLGTRTTSRTSPSVSVFSMSEKGISPRRSPYSNAAVRFAMPRASSAATLSKAERPMGFMKGQRTE